MELQRRTVEGLDNFLSLAEELNNAGNKVYGLFTGSKDPATGVSWCSDCVQAEPVIEEVISKMKFSTSTTCILITCYVGDRASWKDMSNPFRTNPATNLKGVPTLLEWKTPKRVGPDDCSKAGMVSLIFEED